MTEERWPPPSCVPAEGSSPAQRAAARFLRETPRYVRERELRDNKRKFWDERLKARDQDYFPNSEDPVEQRILSARAVENRRLMNEEMDSRIQEI